MRRFLTILGDRFGDALANLSVPLHLGFTWAFGTYVGEIATPWTIGWMILWLIFAPAAFWGGVLLLMKAFHFATASLVALVAAAPFYPEALTTVTTLIVALMFGGSSVFWLPSAVFVAIVVGIYVLNTGGL